jgi:hypothetical protein
MGFFTTRERAQLGKSAEIRERGQVRELVRHDFAPRRRPPEQDVIGHVGSLLQRATQRSVQDIDDLIAVLQRRREQLVGENSRMQREVIEFARMSQSTMQSTRIISESLALFNRVPDAPPLSELHVAAGAEPGDGTSKGGEQQRDDDTETSAQHADGEGGDRAEEAAVVDRSPDTA